MTARIALALLAIVAATMAYPWQSTSDRWVLVVAIVVVLVASAWWRGLFLTTMIGRRMAVWRRNHAKPAARPSKRATVLLRVDAPDAGAAVPLAMVAGYVERFGIRAAKVRVTSRDQEGARTTWVGVTLGADDNLPALLARSQGLPLYETAAIVGRRLAGQLREAGFGTTIVDTVHGPLAGHGHESWRAVRDDLGLLVAYGIPADERLGDRLAEVWSHTWRATWTALEFGGTTTAPTVVAVCAFRTDEVPSKPPLPGLQIRGGEQRPLLSALDPRSVDRLPAPAAPLPNGLLDGVNWHATTDRQENMKPDMNRVILRR